MRTTLVVEYLEPTEESRTRYIGQPQRLHFPLWKSGDRRPDALPDSWRKDSVDKIEYFRKWGFADEQEIIFLPDFVIANLTGLFVTKYFPNSTLGYRWGETCGPEHARWLYTQPATHGFTEPFLVALQWEEEEFRDYEVPPNLTSIYAYARDDDSQETDERRWERLGYPKSEFQERYMLVPEASLQDLSQAAGMPIVVATWNPRKRRTTEPTPTTTDIVRP